MERARGGAERDEGRQQEGEPGTLWAVVLQFSLYAQTRRITGGSDTILMCFGKMSGSSLEME